MNGKKAQISAEEFDLTPLARLLVAHAGRDAPWHRAVWAFDLRLRDALLRAGEPMLAQLRLAWWRDSIRQNGAGARDPLLIALTVYPERADALCQMVDGWEAALDVNEAEDEALIGFARARGEGLFGALGADAARAASAGARWALWSVPADLGIEPRVAGALADRVAAPLPGKPQSALPRPLRIASHLAEGDLKRGRAGPLELTPGLYARLLAALVLG